ncbi:MAG: hypothetical protein KKD21_11630 [Proteobacteria bacterium]|nr:hypothetical protein [Pseudomonadota bacterium]MBU1697672.1 hypothetical protein [Pseudomonadota bacterium]
MNEALQKFIGAEKSDLFDVLEYVFNSDIGFLQSKAHCFRIGRYNETMCFILY